MHWPTPKKENEIGKDGTRIIKIKNKNTINNGGMSTLNIKQNIVRPTVTTLMNERTSEDAKDTQPTSNTILNANYVQDYTPH